MVLLMVSANTTYAHPGNTDSSGGHTCRTNCGNWGLNYGEYHYHDLSPSSAASDYDDGYEQGYDLAYSYSSQCEEDYEWWWEGPQAFGDGYKQGIEDGHQDGLLVCYEDSYDAGNDQGYSDYIDEYEYDGEPNETYEYTSYEKGYSEGWALAESEDDIEVDEVSSYSSSGDSSLDPDEDSSFEEDISPIDQQSLFEDGFDDGYEAVEEDYLYDDFDNGLNESERQFYKKGYFAGYIEGGVGNPGENIYYYLFQKYLLATILIATITLAGLLWFILKRRTQSK
jgi:hypothetical protein